jgi:hypothetical protein
VVSAPGTVTGVKATATASAPGPVVTAAATVNAVTATATATAPAPFVQAGGAANVAAVKATATGTAPAPVVTGASPGNVTATKATATALAPAPAVTVTVDIHALAAQAAATALAPLVGGATTVAATTATATGSATAPSRINDGSILDRDLILTVTLGTPNWSASLDRWIWRAHINPPEGPVYANDRAIYTPTVTITAADNTADLSSTVFLMRIDDGAWVAPDTIEVDGNVARLKLLLGTDAYPVTAGRAKVWARINDTPEDFDIFAGHLRVEPAPA